MAIPHSSLSGLAWALVQENHLTEAEAVDLTAQSNSGGVTFVAQLVASGRMTPLAVAQFASATFHLPLLDLQGFDEAFIPVEAMDKKLIRSHQILPLMKRKNRLAVAVADPTLKRALDDVRFQTGMVVESVVVEVDKLTALVNRFTESVATTLQELAGNELDADLSTEAAVVPEEMEAGLAEVDDAPVVRFIQKILLDAIAEGASDIHFEPYERYYRIRYRTDGVLREVAQPPIVLKEKIASRLKVISRLDISEKRLPQDGRMKLVLSKARAVDFRVSSLPTLFGEKIVVRILESSSALLNIDNLGYEPGQKEALLRAINRPYGMVLVTGPTGSGKTVSLYTCLSLLNKPGANICTAEDPAEINLPGINQVNINDKAGLSFASALRSFLRQDPDVIMVGEIRDLETAEVSVKAAQTGHLVLSTLHTNDAPGTLTRLVDMGVAPFNIASSVVCIVAQRLVRKLCSCKRPSTIPKDVLLQAGFLEGELDGSWTLYTAGGCERCKQSGYRGRVGVYQVMPVSETVAHLIMSGGNALDIAALARREGVQDLRRSGLNKVKQGLTSLEEVLANTNDY